MPSSVTSTLLLGALALAVAGFVVAVAVLVGLAILFEGWLFVEAGRQ